MNVPNILNVTLNIALFQTKLDDIEKRVKMFLNFMGRKLIVG